MASQYIPKTLREQVHQRAGGRCEYCRTPEWLVGVEHEIDHITPRIAGGSSDLDNLCLACSACNGYKQAKQTSFDPDTGKEVALFHPQQQRWDEHFGWDTANIRIIGLTPCGRATVEALQLNHYLLVVARTIWVSFGYHPPV